MLCQYDHGYAIYVHVYVALYVVRVHDDLFILSCNFLNFIHDSSEFVTLFASWVDTIVNASHPAKALLRPRIRGFSEQRLISWDVSKMEGNAKKMLGTGPGTSRNEVFGCKCIRHASYM